MPPSNKLVINTQSVTFMALQQALAAEIELPKELVMFAADFNVYKDTKHDRYSEHIELLKELKLWALNLIADSLQTMK